MRIASAILLVACASDPAPVGDVNDVTTQSLGSTPREIAENALKSRGEFKYLGEQVSLTGYHENFQQLVDGVPLQNGLVRVHLDKNKRVASIGAIARLPEAARRSGSIAQDEAIATAEQGLSLRKRSTAGKVIAQGNREAWSVQVRAVAPFADWEVLVATDTGEVLSKEDRAQHVTGWVFNPNPVDTSGKLDLTDEDNSDSELLTAQRVEVELLDLDNSGTLTGTYATTVVSGARAVAPFNYTRSVDAFEETMVYYHLTTMQHYLQSLGFNNINNRQITANVNTITDDNSYYSPFDKEVTFGTGGVDDAEDASIIYHEAGHAIQDNQVPGWGSSSEARAMGEGFGDYWAASAFNKSVEYAFVGTWDAVSYNPSVNGVPAFLRRLDTPKHYPEDKTGEPHDDGEIWSACLWKLWGLAGKARADQLILEAHFHLQAGPSFADAANAILAVNDTLFAGADKDAIRKIFVDRGILTAQVEPPTPPQNP